MQIDMVGTAQRNGELVAGFQRHCPRLGMGQVVCLGKLATDKARFTTDMPQVEDRPYPLWPRRGFHR